MAILSTLLAMSEPQGMWESIIRAFEGATNNYILAIILLTVIVRLVWAPMDTLNRRVSQKNALVQAKMKPELDKLQEKYGNNPQLFKQKQNELYKKYNGNTMGSCLFMLIFMALNMVIFFTLLSGLNSISAYKINQNYENLKYEYTNCLDIAKNYIDSNPENIEVFKDYNKLSFEVYTKEGVEFIGLKHIDQEGYLFEQEYKHEKDLEYIGEDQVKVHANEYIVPLLQSVIVRGEGEIVLIDEVKDSQGNITTPKLIFADAVQAVAIRRVQEEYKTTQDSFLWIQNIWIADSPFEKQIFDYNGYKSKVGKANVGENEEGIYNCFMKDLRKMNSGVNGYFILPILCVLASVLTMLLSNRKKKGSEGPVAPAGGKAMMIIMPLILGIFALFYNAVFAIYMFISQVISALLIPLQNLILDKWQKHSDKKKKEKEPVVEVDYRRKF